VREMTHVNITERLAPNRDRACVVPEDCGGERNRQAQGTKPNARVAGARN